MAKAYLDPMDDIIKDVEVLTEEIRNQLRDVGIETQRKMIAFITDNKKRPQNGEPTTLEEHITVTTFEGDNGWGVGDIDELNQFAEYWAAVNWGSAHMVGKRVPNGSFSPVEPEPNIAFFRQDRWVAGAENKSFVIQNAIPAMNYIEKTVDWLNSRLDTLDIKVG